MKLMTADITRRLPPLYSQDDKDLDAHVIVKYFNPRGAGTWLITEGEEQEDGDWMLFGYCHFTEWEWGYLLLSELESIGFIERDLYTKPSRVADYL